MGVRVRLRIRVSDLEVITSALVNSGFESTEPELIIPPPLADILRLTGSGVAEYRLVGGGGVSGLRVDEVLKISLVLGDRDTDEVDAVGTVLPGEDEVIISDRLASKLGIVIIDPYEGLWCLRDEVGRKVRRSAGMQLWR